jgi:phosphomannomutase/phosphoglucomutase
LHGTQIQELRKLIEKNLKSTPEPAPERGNVSDREIIAPYIEHLLKGAQARRPLKVVLDAGNGTAGNVAPELFRKLGAQVIELYCELDGRFPNHHPDPTELKNLKDLQALVLKEKADIGLAFDGDSDRIGAVDEKGKPIFGDELMVILSRDVLKKNPGATIISEVKSSHRLYQDIEAKGGKGIMWKTGHSLIKSKMKESGALLAGEMSGHIFFADRYFGYDDAIYAALRLYEIAGEHSGPVSTLISDLPPMMATPELRVDCEEDKKFALVEEVRKRLSPHHKVIGIDGVRVDFGDSWGLVRASNTQPVLVLRYEAPHAARMREIREILENSLKAASEMVGHRPLEVPK